MSYSAKPSRRRWAGQWEKGLPLDLTRYGGGYAIDTHTHDPGDGVEERFLYWYEGTELGTVWVDGTAQVWYFFRQADGCYKLTNDTGPYLTCLPGDSVLTMQPDVDGSNHSHWKPVKANVENVNNTPRNYYPMSAKYASSNCFAATNDVL